VRSDPEIVHGEAALFPGFAQGFQGNIQADLVAVFEEVRKSFGNIVHSHRLFLDAVHLNA
jgi:hypothetical protein